MFFKGSFIQSFAVNSPSVLYKIFLPITFISPSDSSIRSCSKLWLSWVSPVLQTEKLIPHLSDTSANADALKRMPDLY